MRSSDMTVQNSIRKRLHRLSLGILAWVIPLPRTFRRDHDAHLKADRCRSTD